MKKYMIIVLSLAFITTAVAEHKQVHLLRYQSLDLSDTMPQICSVLPAEDMATLHPFANILSKIYPDPNQFETYSGCYYEFYTKNDYPGIAVRMVKWVSGSEAGADFKMNFQRHFESWGIAPERLYRIADSAYFSIETEDTAKCNECHLLAIQGTYTITISFKGQYEEVPRARKKESALKILQLMYDRIPGLAPSRIRNKQ